MLVELCGKPHDSPASLAIQQRFSKPSLVKLISKEAKLFISLYQNNDYDVIIDFRIDGAKS